MTFRNRQYGARFYFDQPETTGDPLLMAAAVTELGAAGRVLGASQRPLDCRRAEGGGGAAALAGAGAQEARVAASCQAGHHNSLRKHFLSL
jgi:hypothetical protein